MNYTILEPATLIADVEKNCVKAINNKMASVCVPPIFVKKAKQIVANSNVKVATVIGFPLGYSAVEAKLAEILLAIVDGADVLEMVINLTALKNNDWQYLANELNTILPIVRSKQKCLKIIIECGILTDDEVIKCCDLYGIAGVDFLKTSTGFEKKEASQKQVSLIRKHLSNSVKIDANGGINTALLAYELIHAGADLISSNNCIEIIKENS
ncbi:MAG: deoxyribose-phosphate aldolase [Ferruginibacter sp.]